jgi:anti-sigma factor RsiW
VNHPSELISAYLDGELTDRERADLIRHLAGCGKCSAEMEETHEIRAAVRSLPMLELPIGLIPEDDPVVVPLRSHKGLWAGVAAAIVIAVIAVAALVTPPTASTSMDHLNSLYGARSSVDPAFSPAKVVVPSLEDAG